MPDNPRIEVKPTANPCWVTDAFLESPGLNTDHSKSGFAFWESPGRERRSGAVLPEMIGRQVAAGKAFQGVRPQDLGLIDNVNEPTTTPFADRFSFNQRRFLRQSLTYYRFDSINPTPPQFEFTESWETAVNRDTGVPTGLTTPELYAENGQVARRYIWMPSVPFAQSLGPLYGDTLTRVRDWTALGRTDEVVQFSGGVELRVNGRSTQLLADENDPALDFEKVRAFCEGYSLDSLDWATFPNGVQHITSAREFHPGIAGNYQGTNFSSYDGALGISNYTSDSAHFRGRLLEIAGWAWSGTTFPVITAFLADVRFPASDPLPERRVTIVESRRLMVNGGEVTQDTYLGSRVVRKGEWLRWGVVPSFDLNTRYVNVFAIG